MKAIIKHNNDTIHIENDECDSDELLNFAIKKINSYYSHHINEVHIGDQVIKFHVKIEQV